MPLLYSYVGIIVHPYHPVRENMSAFVYKMAFGVQLNRAGVVAQIAKYEKQASESATDSIARRQLTIAANKMRAALAS